MDAKHQEWFELPHNRETMGHCGNWHAAQGHNHVWSYDGAMTIR
jgi:hypothetical protein